MSGIIGSKLNIRGSGRIAKLGTDGQVLTSSGAGVAAAFEDAAGGGSDWQSVETGSTMTAVAGNGYPINTTSNACTVTLPAGSVGDTIELVDYAGTWDTNNVTLTADGSENIKGTTSDYTLEVYRQGIKIVYVDATQGWVATTGVNETAPAIKPPGNEEGIFGFGGGSPSSSSTTNLVSNTGVVSSDVTGVGQGRENLTACEFGGDKGIFFGGWSNISPTGNSGKSNLVSNTGVVATDVAAVTSVDRYGAGGCEYGEDKGIFFGGYGGPVVQVTAITNLVSNSGVMQSDTAAVVGVSARQYVGMCEYGFDKGIIGFGNTQPTKVSTTNLISNSGVVATDVAGVVGVTIRQRLGACSYGQDKGIFSYGSTGSDVSVSNLVSNAGVVATDVTGVGTARSGLAACEYGYDKAIFGYGNAGSGCTNLVTNAGVVGTDVTGVGTSRDSLAACSFN